MSTYSMMTSNDFHPARPPLASSPMYALPPRRIRDVLSRFVPELTLTSVEEVSPVSTRLSRLYTLNLPDSEHLILAVAPTLAVRLLRHEQTLLLSEAVLISFLSDVLRTSRSSYQEGTSLRGDQHEFPFLSRIVPTVLRHSSNSREMGYPYTIFEPAAGAPLVELFDYLNLTERRVVDKQVGTFARELALNVSPTGTFGTASSVIPHSYQHTPASGPSNIERRTWLAAFMSLVEGILRDGEDMSVLLPYGNIRRQFSRVSWRLNAVTTPRLLIVDLGKDSSLLVERDPEEGTAPHEDPIRITGLTDWSQGYFGDPLLSACFEDPSEAFLNGWIPSGHEELIEDQSGIATRLLLYKCYRAVVEIVIEHYRPRTDSSRRELDARRRLTNALTELERADSEPPELKRLRSQQDEAGEAAKRQKLEENQAS